MEIIVNPRIHISLISMHADGYRLNGGIGFSLDEPKGVLNFKISDHFEYSDLRETPLPKVETERLKSVLKKVQSSLGLKHNIKVLVEGEMLTHYGMGSGTVIRLACIEALLLLNTKDVTRSSLITYSNRGGTSGIGINTYFDGGFVFDIGAINRGNEFLPSASVREVEPPMLLDSMDMPDWKVGLCIAKNLKIKTQQEEREFFKRTCPINAQECYKTLYHSLFGVYASVRENNLDVFLKAIKEIQLCEWKRMERAEHGEELLKLESKLYQLGANCVGMSSLGPLLFFLADDNHFEDIVNAMPEEDCKIIITSCSNSGRKIII